MDGQADGPLSRIVRASPIVDVDIDKFFGIAGWLIILQPCGRHRTGGEIRDGELGRFDAGIVSEGIEEPEWVT